MLSPKSRPSRGRVLGVLDVGSSKVSCMIAEVEPHPVKPTVRLLGVATLPSHGVKAGTVLDLEPAADAARTTIAMAERQAGVTLSGLTVGVACGRLLSRRFSATSDVAGRSVTAGDIDKVRHAAARFLRRDGRNIVDLVELDYQLDGTGGIADPVGMSGARLSARLHAVTADDFDLRNLLHIVERCRLTADAVAVAGCASALSVTTEEERRLGVTCIDIGAGTMLLASFLDGKFVWTDMIPVGGNHLTFDIAHALAMPLAEAERIKTFYGTVARASSDDHQLISLPRGGEDGQAYQITLAELRAIVQPRAEAMVAALGDSLGEAIRRGLVCDNAGARIVLTGGASELVGLPALAAGLLHRDVKLRQPTPLPGLPAGIATAPLATAFGLLAWALRSQHARSAIAASGFEPPDYFGRVRQWFSESF